MNNTKIFNVISSLVIFLLSTLSSYYIVVSTSDFTKEINWYVHLFFGDEKYYFFNIIPMAAWALVVVFEFLVIFILIASILHYIKRFIPIQYKNGREVMKEQIIAKHAGDMPVI